MKKSVRHIMIFILSLVTMYLGTGVAFVHICSAYCKVQKQVSCSECLDAAFASDSGKSCGLECSSPADIKESCLCCHVQPESSCSCLDITVHIDFFRQLSQQAQAVVAQWPIDLPEQWTASQTVVSDLLGVYVLAPNAPPFENGRAVLAFHCILLI